MGESAVVICEPGWRGGGSRRACQKNGCSSRLQRKRGSNRGLGLRSPRQWGQVRRPRRHGGGLERCAVTVPLGALCGVTSSTWTKRGDVLPVTVSCWAAGPLLSTWRAPEGGGSLREASPKVPEWP